MHIIQQDPLLFFFFFNDTAHSEIYTLLYTLSLHDALPISLDGIVHGIVVDAAIKKIIVATGEIGRDTSELQSHSNISYAVFCWKKKKTKTKLTQLSNTLCYNREYYNTYTTK